MSETALLQEIRIDLGRVPGVRLFRNNVGLLRDQRGNPVRFGLHPGSGDLCGWRSITITPEMVGDTIACFASIEVKTPIGRVRPEQEHWAEAVLASGGMAGVARSPSQARLILGLPT